MAKMFEYLEKVRGLIRANALNELNPQGLLTSNLQDYL